MELVGIGMTQLLERTIQQFLIKSNIHIPHDPAILLLNIYPKK